MNQEFKHLRKVNFGGVEAQVDINIIEAIKVIDGAAKIVFGEGIAAIFKKNPLPSGLLDLSTKQYYGLDTFHPYPNGKYIRMGYKSPETGQYILMIDKQEGYNKARKNMRKLLENTDINLLKIK